MPKKDAAHSNEQANGTGMSSQRNAPAVRGIDILRLLLRYYVFLLPIFVGLVSTGFYYTVRGQYYHDWERHAVDVCQNLNVDLLRQLKSSSGQCLPPSEWQTGGVLDEVEKLSQQYLRTLYVTRINIFSDEGRVVYSSEPGLAGRISKGNAKLEGALAGEIMSDVEEASHEPDFVDAGHQQNWLETYVPLRLLNDAGQPEGKVVGAFEVYQSIGEMEAALRTLAGQVIFGSMGVLLLLGLVLLGVGRRISQLVQTERDEQYRLKTLLEQAVDHLEDEVTKRIGEVHRERETLSTVLDEAPSAFVLLDEVGRIQYTSRRFLDLVGVAAQKVVGQFCWDAWSCQLGREQCVALLAMKENALRRILSSSVGSNTSNRWLEHVAAPIQIKGSPIRAIVMITDVTDRRQTEEQLARAARLVTAGEVAATVAHEVRNAATSTKLFLQLLEERRIFNESDSCSLEAALASVSRMEALVENLLRLVRPAIPKMVPLDVLEVLHAAIDLVRPDAQRKRVRIQESEGAASLPCQGDWALLAQAFLNLLLNAVQAFDSVTTKDKHEVVVQTRIETYVSGSEDASACSFLATTFLASNGSAGADAPRLVSGSPAIMVEFCDNATGLPAGDESRVFEPFFTTKPDGTGLGIPIVRRVVEGHGGKLIFLPNPSGGTIVRVILPLPQRKQDQEAVV